MTPTTRTTNKEQITEHNWRKFAACRGLDINLFFPDRGVSHWEIRNTKEVCESCVVRDFCLEDALSQDEDPGGVWGGTSGRERRALRRVRERRQAS